MRIASLLVFVLLATGIAGGGPASVKLDAPRAAHTATLLPSGLILVAGGCTGAGCEVGPASSTTELVDPATGTSRPGPDLPRAKLGHHAVVLRDGSVLLAGGWDDSGLTTRADVYADGRFEQVGALRSPRGGATATLLRDGRVLFAGGSSGGSRMLASTELYDPRTRRFTSAGSMHEPRNAHAAVLLRDGRVLIAGGLTGRRVVRTAEVFDPRTRKFTRVGSMRVARHKLAAAPLPGGGALVLGGSDERDFAGRVATVERFDAKRNRFVGSEPLVARRFKFADAVAALPNGNVVVAGGAAQIEVYDPISRRFRVVDRIEGERYFSTATALPDGRVFLAGGYDASIDVTDRAFVLGAY